MSSLGGSTNRANRDARDHLRYSQRIMTDRDRSNHSTSLRSMARRAYVALVPHRRAINALADALVWTTALGAATVLRYDFSFGRVAWTGLLLIVPLAVACQFIFGLADGLYL